MTQPDPTFVIPFEDMPEDNAELASMAVDFPRLADDSAEPCPEPLKDVIEYLNDELEGVGSVARGRPAVSSDSAAA